MDKTPRPAFGDAALLARVPPWEDALTWACRPGNPEATAQTVAHR